MDSLPLFAWTMSHVQNKRCSCLTRPECPKTSGGRRPDPGQTRREGRSRPHLPEPSHRHTGEHTTGPTILTETSTSSALVPGWPEKFCSLQPTDNLRPLTSNVRQ